MVQHRRVSPAFSPSPQAFGNAGVGIMRGPGFANFDFTFAKNFRVDDRRRFQFRTEIFNAFNQANFGPPNIARDSSGFGQILTAAQRPNRPVRVEVLLLTAAGSKTRPTD